MPLKNPKHQAFCEQYIVDLNATAAYQRVPGYTAKGHAAESAANRLLRNVEVQAEIARLMAARSKRVELTADRVLKRLAQLVFADFRKVYRDDGTKKLPHELDDDTAAAVAHWETEEEAKPGRGKKAGEVVTVRTTTVKLWDNPRAVSMAMEHLGLNQKLTLETVLVLLGPLGDRLRQLIADPVPGGGGSPGPKGTGQAAG